ncbi:hypothetical protein CLAFUW4_09750 [Fulvia fulva]|uniref:Uncharacterized protein n=1 Tax=Passalora fulva TaxID=5499 RepID=A0A9Q8UUC6_PASFU|nr:uncharacterized protein CLAFUR5_12488 [Fulvia fulva]KAK4616304.1 hypothetical protein CLAFUR4_09755 [Fulvia fulva]KAK4617016.1 hypothetical protein CLAFUR0_09747 [Fulvia fulva]UJO22809.1 hypothetical protein CLAFUR5_12488 [Fulvia fulva]WPV19156.1 hypothetical protein CLAFUW4_09750 [Fulvia fulva]WPV34209.1 hypothetical protein CLAFUW7_09752 [Fulvia fulva]
MATYTHWLSETPTEYMQHYLQEEWHAASDHDELLKIRYYSFTIRAFVFRGDRLFLTNRTNSSSAEAQLSVLADRLDVSLMSLIEDEPPVYRVEQDPEVSIRDHVRTALSARYHHPAILENVRFLDEFSFAEPTVRRRVEGSTPGIDSHIYICDFELSIVLSKFYGSLGSGPAYRWTTEADIDEAQLVAGLDLMHISDMFRKYHECKEDEAFHERCKDAVRKALAKRWWREHTDKAFRFGVIAHQPGRGSGGISIFSVNLPAAAARKDAVCIEHEGARYHIVGRFAGDSVQLSTEVETWTPMMRDDGSIDISWNLTSERTIFY